MRERLKAKPNPVVCQYLTEPALAADSKRSFLNLADINLSHILMLYKQGIIDKDDADALLRAMAEIRDNGVSGIELDPEKEDFYFNISKLICCPVVQVCRKSANRNT